MDFCSEDLDPSMFELFLVRGGVEKIHLIKLGRCEENHSALSSSVKRVVLVSSVGVTKSNELPWSIMNLFGVLKYKKMGEDFLRDSGLPFTIFRPGRLTDGPYTSYDLNTLLKATTGERRDVVIGQGDKVVGEVRRLVVAEACIHALDIEFSRKAKLMRSIQLRGSDPQKWRELFKVAEEDTEKCVQTC